MTNGKLSEYFHSDSCYRALWRWHFYAGLFVMPFLLVLTLSGLCMLLSKPLEAVWQRELLSVPPQQGALPASTLLQTVRAQYPDAAVHLYIPPGSATTSARFSLSAGNTGHAGHNSPSTTVYVNPYTAEVLGALDPARTFYAQLKKFHSSLFLDDVGDALLEMASGLAVLMIVSGLLMAWVKGTWRIALPRLPIIRREDWRKLHRSLGVLLVIPLLFFLLSGLAWTNVWGGKLVQAWSTLPGTRYQAPQQEHTHEALNQHGLHRVPWAVAQTPLPRANAGPEMLDLDAIVAFARAQGFDPFRVHLPRGEGGVWTISATAIAGDLRDPRDERILHLEPSSGKILADLSFADYSAMGKAMAASIPLHQGDLGVWNLILNAVLVSLVITMIVSGFLMWWKRRAALTLDPPSATRFSGNIVLAVMLVLALCFPLSALAIGAASVVDLLLISRVARLRAVFK